MRSLFLSLLIAILVALPVAGVVSFTASDAGVEPRLRQLAADEALPPMVSRRLRDEPKVLTDLFIAWADTPALVFNGALALERHEKTARLVLTEYGSEPAFKEMLTTYGPDVVLPIAYFYRNPIKMLDAQHWVSARVQNARDSVSSWWQVNEESSTSASTTESETDVLTPEMRGLIAVDALQQAGYGFLNQFVVDKTGAVKWLQSERAMAVLNDFFTGGIRGVERAYRSGNAVSGADMAWAGVEVLGAATGVVGAFKATKLLKAGRASRTAKSAKSGKAMQIAKSQKTTETASTAARNSSRLKKMAKDAALFGAGSGAGTLLSTSVKVGMLYAAVRHPQLISGLGATIARWLGWPIKFVQFLVWFAVLSPVLWLAGLLYRWVIRPTVWLLMFSNTLRRAPAGRDPAPIPTV